MITKITSGIKISVETFFKSEQSDILHSKYVFAYRITIENNSVDLVQLKRRYWNIFDSVGEINEVQGEGVVGEQPILKSGQTYQYVSFCHLKSETGRMKGSYFFEKGTESIQVKIPEFNLIVPYRLN